MRTMQPAFQEAFVKQCYEQGMSEDLTLDLFRQAHLKDLLENDEDFRAGWDREMAKHASLWAKGLKALNGMSWKAKALTGAAGIGGTGAAIKHFAPDAAAFIEPLQAPSRSFTTPVAAGVGAGAGLHAGIKLMGKMKGPWWARGLAALGATALGAGAGGGAGYAAGVPSSNGPSMANIFLPDALGPATPVNKSTASLLDIPGTGSSSSAAKSGLTVGAQMIEQANAQVKGLDRSIAEARAQEATALKTPGIQGSAQAAEIRRRIADLEKQKAEILNNSNGFLGQMRQQQGQSLRSLDRAQAEAMRARAQRQPRADAMDRWLRRENQNSLIYRLISHILGVQNQASQMSSQMRNLDEVIRSIEANRNRVNNMLLPGT